MTLSSIISIYSDRSMWIDISTIYLVDGSKLVECSLGLGFRAHLKGHLLPVYVAFSL